MMMFGRIISLLQSAANEELFDFNQVRFISRSSKISTWALGFCGNWSICI